MSYQVPYVATFRCEKGHEFVADASPLKENEEVMCPHCFNEWVAANVPNGRQISKAEVRKMVPVYD